MDHPDGKHDCCHEDSAAKKTVWHRKPSVLWTGIVLIVYTVSFLFPALERFRHELQNYPLKMALPIGVGLLAGGIIDYYIPREYISKYLTSHHKRTVLYATGLGFLMSACSHGILALSIELHKKGASGPAVISFLLASPWANLPITFLLVGFFGLKGIVIILLSLAVAFSTGLIFQRLDRAGLIEKNPHTVAVSREFSILEDLKKRFKNYRASKKDLQGILKGAWDLADMVLMWLWIGILLASLAAAFLPHSIFENYFGPSLLGLLMTMLAATIFEVCSEGTSPLAFEIYRRTGALGNSFAFLMGGVVTDYTEIGLVWQRLGKKTALWMLAISLPQVFIFALILNYFSR